VPFGTYVKRIGAFTLAVYYLTFTFCFASFADIEHLFIYIYI
jgi:hypothetical protein